MTAISITDALGNKGVALYLTDYEASNTLWLLEHIAAGTVPAPYNTGDWVGQVRNKIAGTHIKHWGVDGPNVPYGEI